MKSERRNSLPKAQGKLQLLIQAWHFPESSLQFFCIISWVVLYSSFIVRLVCFLLRLSCHSNVSKKFDFCFREFRKAIACLCVTHIAQISTDVVLYVEIYLGKRHWQKYITQQLNSVLFINMTKDLQYYILPRYA